MEPVLDCRPVTALGLADRGLPTSAIHVSGTEEGYNKDWVRLESRVGWCGSSQQQGPVVTSDPDLGNFVTIDLKAPTIVKGFRAQGVQRLDGRLAFPKAIRLMYADDIADKFQSLKNSDGTQVEFRVLDGASVSAMILPNPIEARYIRFNIVNFEQAACMKLEINGCGRTQCQDVNECFDQNGGCDQKCVNSAGGFQCKCNVGYDLYTGNGTSEYYIPETETGLRDGDTFRLNKTCVRKTCPKLAAPAHGSVLTDMDHYRFGDQIKFQCDFGYVMRGVPSLLCTSTGDWNGTVAECVRATCTTIQDNLAEGLEVDSGKLEDDFQSQVGFGTNISLSCNQVGRPLPDRVTSGFRQCVYDPRPNTPDYWLAGAPPSCPRIGE